MINLLVYVLVLCIVFGLIFWLLQMLPLPAPWGQVVQVVAGIICILILLGLVFGGISVPRLSM
jgi:hypothetical protein